MSEEETVHQKGIASKINLQEMALQFLGEEEVFHRGSFAFKIDLQELDSGESEFIIAGIQMNSLTIYKSVICNADLENLKDSGNNDMFKNTHILYICLLDCFRRHQDKRIAMNISASSHSNFVIIRITESPEHYDGYKKCDKHFKFLVSKQKDTLETSLLKSAIRSKQ